MEEAVRTPRKLGTDIARKVFEEMTQWSSHHF